MSTRNLVWRHVAHGACGYCGHRHALDIEYRCYGCDRGVCAVCLVTVVEAREGYCPECAAEGDLVDSDSAADPDSGGDPDSAESDSDSDSDSAGSSRSVTSASASDPDADADEDADGGGRGEA